MFFRWYPFVWIFPLSFLVLLGCLISGCAGSDRVLQSDHVVVAPENRRLFQVSFDPDQIVEVDLKSGAHLSLSVRKKFPYGSKLDRFSILALNEKEVAYVETPEIPDQDDKTEILLTPKFRLVIADRITFKPLFTDEFVFPSCECSGGWCGDYCRYEARIDFPRALLGNYIVLEKVRNDDDAVRRLGREFYVRTSDGWEKRKFPGENGANIQVLDVRDDGQKYVFQSFDGEWCCGQVGYGNIGAYIHGKFTSFTPERNDWRISVFARRAELSPNGEYIAYGVAFFDNAVQEPPENAPKEIPSPFVAIVSFDKNLLAKQIFCT